MRRAKADRYRELQERSREDYEHVVRKDGKVVRIAPQHVDHLKDKKGLRPAGRNKVSGSLFFGMSQATQKYVRGLDDLDFIWNDGWEPAPLFSRGASGPQRDPDGNVWVRNEENGDWELEV